VPPKAVLLFKNHGVSNNSPMTNKNANKPTMGSKLSTVQTGLTRSMGDTISTTVSPS
jgi:hypothetical protein